MNYNINEPQRVATITMLKLVESKSYRNQYIRPYEMNVGYNDINAIGDIVTRAVGNNSLNGIQQMVNDINPNILLPSSNIVGEAGIANGWGEKRFKFVMILEITTPGSNSTIINYVQGYSEFLGISMSGLLDPNMKLYVNSVTVLRKTFDASTGMVNVVPLNSFNAVHDELNVSAYYDNFNSLKLARPDDVLTGISTLQSTEPDTTFTSDVGSVNGINMVDKSTILPTMHVGTTLNSAVNSALMSSAFTAEDDIVSTMVGDTLSYNPERIEFFALLLQARGRLGTDFTLTDLQNFNPPYMGVPDVILNDQSGIITNTMLPQQLLTEDTADTYDMSYETRLSTLVHESVVNVLNESLLNHVVFEIDNLSGSVNGHVLFAKSYIDGINLQYYGDLFIQLFIKRAWPSLSNNNMSSVKILVTAMLESDTTISLSTDGRPEVIYRYPTFADSKYIPLIMDNQRLDVLTENYADVVSTAVGACTNTVRNNSKLIY